MSDHRVQHLLERELDGDLTTLENTELERAIRLDADARRRRAGWQRVQDSLRSVRTEPRINTRKMAASIVQELPQRRSPTRFVYAAVAAAVLLAFVAPSVGPVTRAPSKPVAVRSVGFDRTVRAPVVVYVEDGALMDEREPVPVEIQF